MKRYLLNSDDCYEGYNIEEECWWTGDCYFLSQVDEIDESTIEFSQDFWEQQVSFFENFVRDEKKKFEEKHKDEVVGIALCGRLGFWNGSPTGGKIVDFDNIFQMNVDDIDVTVEHDDIIQINGHHHDGSHHMNLYFLTEKNMKKIKIWKVYDELGFDDFTYEEFEKIANNLEPLKLSEDNKYYDYAYCTE